MEIESITNKFSNQEKNMRGYFNISPLNEKSLTYKAFLNPFRYKLSMLLRAKMHTQHDASAEKDPPAGLSSIRIPTLDKV